MEEFFIITRNKEILFLPKLPAEEKEDTEDKFLLQVKIKGEEIHFHVYILVKLIGSSSPMITEGKYKVQNFEKILQKIYPGIDLSKIEEYFRQRLSTKDVTDLENNPIYKVKENKFLLSIINMTLYTYVVIQIMTSLLKKGHLSAFNLSPSHKSESTKIFSTPVEKLKKIRLGISNPILRTALSHVITYYSLFNKVLREDPDSFNLWKNTGKILAPKGILKESSSILELGKKKKKSQSQDGEGGREKIKKKKSQSQEEGNSEGREKIKKKKSQLSEEGNSEGEKKIKKKKKSQSQSHLSEEGGSGGGEKTKKKPYLKKKKSQSEADSEGEKKKLLSLRGGSSPSPKQLPRERKHIPPIVSSKHDKTFILRDPPKLVGDFNINNSVEYYKFCEDILNQHRYQLSQVTDDEMEKMATAVAKFQKSFETEAESLKSLSTQIQEQLQLSLKDMEENKVKVLSLLEEYCGGEKVKFAEQVKLYDIKLDARIQDVLSLQQNLNVSLQSCIRELQREKNSILKELQKSQKQCYVDLSRDIQEYVTKLLKKEKDMPRKSAMKSTSKPRSTSDKVDV